jgi:hypothetical protein
MLNLDDDKLEELRETLYDLKHDLGKYIKLPVTMLPKDAPPSIVAEAVLRGIRETRKSPRGVLSAKMLFSAFDARYGDALSHLASYAALKSSVARAEAWARSAEAAPSSMIREAVEPDLQAVSEAIGALLSEVEGG